jgi:hypothetical protein
MIKWSAAHACCFAIACSRRFISSGDTSSMCVEIHQ